MIPNDCTKPHAQPSYKNEQLPHNCEQKPKGAMLLEVVKTIETELQNRRLIDSPSSELFNPLWFLLETERNVFLWRNGYSLADAGRFEFWVDVTKFVEKRLKQLEKWQGDNPFSNAFWSFSLENQANTKYEQSYLKAFLDILKNLELHAHVLSEVGSILQKEFIPGTKEVVVLPK